MKLPKNFIEDKGSINIGATKNRYRMLADGAVIDQTTKKVIGFIYPGSVVENVWHMNGKERQKFIKQFLKLQ